MVTQCERYVLGINWPCDFQKCRRIVCEASFDAKVNCPIFVAIALTYLCFCIDVLEKKKR